MLKNREQLYQTYHALLSMALTLAITLVINQYFTLKVPIIIAAVYSLIPAILIYFFDMNKKNVISYILMISIIPLLALIFWIKKINPIRLVQNFIDWCIAYDGSQELYKAPFAHFALLGTALLGVILFYIITNKQVAKLILAIVILAVLLILSIKRINVSKAVVGIGIFYIMTIVVELYGFINSKKEGKQDKKEGILYLAPICLLLAVLSISLPSQTDPIKWVAVKNAYDNIKEQIQIWQTNWNYYFGLGQSEFGVSMIGYSENSGGLENGKITDDGRVALKLSGLNQFDTVYLVGSISDVYTGNSWEKSRKDYLPNDQDYFLDYKELFYAMSRQDLKILQDNSFVNKKSIKINYNNIKTKTFFYPLKTTYFSVPSSYSKPLSESSQITFKNAHGKGTTYQDIYFDMNLEGEAFQKMLREADSFSYDNTPLINQETANFLLKDTFLWDNAVVPIDDNQKVYSVLGEREKVIKLRDTMLPEELPDRVKELAYQITAGYDTNYDKLKAIEAYLLTYKYTLDPEKGPKEEDFVDYFLFESKEGYCTSFATAMAVLGRCIGVPTRYVEGFVVRCNGGGVNNIYDVKNSQAHAWAEAYIEGVGWIPFEATAPFYDTRYTKWPEIKKDTSNNTAPVYTYTDYNKEYYENMYKPVISDITAKKHKDKSIDFVNGIVIFFGVIFILLLAIVIYYFILKHRYKKDYEKSDNSNKMYLLFLRILRLLKREGFTLEQQETILMLSKRVKGHLKFNNVTFLDVANIFMRFRYAEEEVTKEQLDRVYNYHFGLSGKQREKENRFKLWLEEFIFLIQTDRQLKRRYNNT